MIKTRGQQEFSVNRASAEILGIFMWFWHSTVLQFSSGTTLKLFIVPYSLKLKQIHGKNWKKKLKVFMYVYIY